MKRLLSLMQFATAGRAPRTGESADTMPRGRRQMLHSHVVLIVVTALVLAGSFSSHFDHTTHLLIVAVTGAKALTDAWTGH
jgi:hypothetical protein